MPEVLWTFELDEVVFIFAAKLFVDKKAISSMINAQLIICTSSQNSNLPKSLTRLIRTKVKIIQP